MKTKMRKTSVDAYNGLQNSEAQRYKIFSHIEEFGPVSIAEIAAGLSMEKSTVSARVNSLANGRKDSEGNWLVVPVIEEAGRWTDDISGVRTIHWKVI